MKKDTPNDHFNKYIGISAVLHILLLGFSAGLMKCSNNEIVLPPSIKVDLVAPPSQLPNKIEPAPETSVPEPEAQAEKLPEKLPEKETPPEQPEGPTVDLEQKKKKKELKKKKDLEKKKEKERKKKKEEKNKADAKKIKNKQTEALNKMKQKEALNKLTKKPVATGKRLSPGSSFSGLDSIKFQQYYDDIKTHLYNNWSLPQWLAELELKAQALVVLDDNGYVIQRKIIKSSGNANFDNTVLGAIDQASPFPLAPNRLQKKITNKEIVFGFPEN